jgi:hypothetical protein
MSGVAPAGSQSNWWTSILSIPSVDMKNSRIHGIFQYEAVRANRIPQLFFFGFFFGVNGRLLQSLPPTLHPVLSGFTRRFEFDTVELLGIT